MKPGPSVSAHFGAFLKDECGITDRRFHDFRRTFITRWARLGFDEYVCKSITGHAHGEVVFDAYKDDADLETKAEWLVKFDPLGDECHASFANCFTVPSRSTTWRVCDEQSSHFLQSLSATLIKM